MGDLEKMAAVECKDDRDHVESRDQWDSQEHQDQPEFPDFEDQEDQKVKRAEMDVLARMETLAKTVQMERQDDKENQELMVLMAYPDGMETPVCRDHVETRETKDREEKVETRALRE